MGEPEGPPIPHDLDRRAVLSGSRRPRRPRCLSIRRTEEEKALFTGALGREALANVARGMGQPIPTTYGKTVGIMLGTKLTPPIDPLQRRLILNFLKGLFGPSPHAPAAPEEPELPSS